MSECVFDSASTRCIEHGGLYLGARSCLGKLKGDRLERQIAKLQAERDAMRLVWVAGRQDD